MQSNDHFINISGYRFVTLYNTKTLQLDLKEHCSRLNLKGSIVLSIEGINIMLAGTEDAIQQFCTALNKDSRFQGMTFKHSASSAQPFEHLFVKCKKSLVPGMEMIRPDLGDSAENISPKQLKQWFESGKEFTLIDTRNNYELEHGTFEKALNLDLQQFAELPEKLALLDPALKSKPIVMFCTGGIRCEKGAPLAKLLGFEQVYQLEGGILKYFEDCGSSHYQGSCFVFDERVALTAELKTL